MAAEDPSRKSGCTIDGAGHRSIVHGTAGLLETLKDRRTSALVRSDIEGNAPRAIKEPAACVTSSPIPSYDVDMSSL
ncbi:hypothetical protein GTA08_BOTSDO07531 [Botryosphaeria dothidea]|uniref:Uncharacterized protein n=1 Tax=Botryosphaeria dothidea TaxID=55169 RepID=A0A8H4INQ1_9PEZI|nr:hypothetical protein GTA08_BOTSDO07531 [Botryosphaeria dothidea]